MVVILLDGYTDEPSQFGVPPYISFNVRYVYGAIKALKKDILYLTIDQLRNSKSDSRLHRHLHKSELVVIIAGCLVPGKYLRGTPITIKEIKSFINRYQPKMTILGGAAARFGFGGIGGEKIVLAKTVKHFFDLVAKQDVDATVYDYLVDGTLQNRKRTYKEWIQWSMYGAELIKHHPDYPIPLMIELEISKGCPRFINGGCNFCIEPLFGIPINKIPSDVIKEVEMLYKFGGRHFRIGGVTDVYSYMAIGIGNLENPKPNVQEWKLLLEGIHNVAPNYTVLHLDNANPAVIAQYPKESRAITKLLVEYCTDGNILPLGLESADKDVIKANNLNTNPEETLYSIKLLNELGKMRGPSGLPKLLPGLNFISGLLGETKKTFKLNFNFLKDIFDQNLSLRRINLRQVASLQQEFRPDKYNDLFLFYKKKIRKEIDQPMLKRILPVGSLVKKVYLEQYDGNFTHGRQIATYALLITIPFHTTHLNVFQDILITGHGYRSVSGLPVPIYINKSPRKILSVLPGFGKKRVTKILLKRPYKNVLDLEKSLDDPNIIESYKEYLNFTDT